MPSSHVPTNTPQPEAPEAPGMRLQFVVLSTPEDGKKRAVRRLVRTQAARGSRHRGTRTPTAPLPQASDDSGADTATRRPAAVTVPHGATTNPSRPYPGEAELELPLILVRGNPDAAATCVMPSPTSLLSSARLDPFDNFARRITPFEEFLIDHCMLPYGPASVGSPFRPFVRLTTSLSRRRCHRQPPSGGFVRSPRLGRRGEGHLYSPGGGRVRRPGAPGSRYTVRSPLRRLPWSRFPSPFQPAVSSFHSTCPSLQA